MRPRIPESVPLRVGVIVAVVAGAVALVWWRGPDWGLVGDAFTAVTWEWVLAAIALNLLSVVVRAVAWDTVIKQAMPAPHPRFRSVFAAFSVGLLANAVLPGRIGELARVAVLTRRLAGRNGAWASLIGSVFAHRLFDLLPAMALVVWVLLTVELPHWALTSLIVAVAVGFAMLTFGVASARRHQRSVLDELGPVRRIVTMARHGLGVLHAPLPAAIAALLQCVGWVCQLLAVYTTMRAFQIDEPLSTAGLVLVLMNIATVFPLWPGNVGLVQAAVALPLVSYGVAYARGFAFGIGLQAIEASVGVAFGLIFLAREGLSFAMLKRMPGAEQAEVPDADLAAAERKEAHTRARVPG